MADAPVRTTRGTDPRAPAWAMLWHLSGLFGLFLVPLNVLFPLAGWLFHRTRSSFVARQAREALNFQLSLLLYGLLAALLQYLPALPHFYLVVSLMLGLVLYDILMVSRTVLALRAGEDPRYPLTIQWV